MVLWVAELSAQAVGVQNVYVATEDERIANVVISAGFNCVMTTDDHLTGTDRVSQAAEQINSDVIINVQGDEPLVQPTDILKVRDAKLLQMDAVINGFCWIGAHEDLRSVNIPKVITNERDEMVYMSRLALPGFKDVKCAPTRYKKQVCIYGFTHAELSDFRAFGRKSELERAEDIEILRFLELGRTVRMVETRSGSLAVDVPDDVPLVEAALKKTSAKAP